MNGNRNPAWKGIGILTLAFIASLILEKQSNLSQVTQAVLMVISVVVFYILLGILANAGSILTEDEPSGQQVTIIYRIESPVRIAEGQIRPHRPITPDYQASDEAESHEEDR